MRGKPTLQALHHQFPRITPAGAGKTPACRCCCWHRKDHPRRCGENDIYREPFKRVAGSPPQVRGKPEWIDYMEAYRGITPAGAGKTTSHSIYPHQAQDHPRRCGENSRAMEHRPRYLGSPPQVRGKRELNFYRRKSDRITPAGAGKTRPLVFHHCVKWDHPRRCGENTEVKHSVTSSPGSPPQVRGKPSKSYILPSEPGITPAGAGKTDLFSGSVGFTRDHPRRCGENLFYIPLP